MKFNACMNVNNQHGQYFEKKKCRCQLEVILLASTFLSAINLLIWLWLHRISDHFVHNSEYGEAEALNFHSNIELHFFLFI